MADNKTASLTVLGGPLAGTLSASCRRAGRSRSAPRPTRRSTSTCSAVSPYHARVVVDAGRVTVHDTGSSRTVHVNDNAIGPRGDGAAQRRHPLARRSGRRRSRDAPVHPARSARPRPRSRRPGVLSSGATPTPEIETVALWATEPPADDPAARDAGSKTQSQRAAAALGEPIAMAFEDEAVVVSAGRGPRAGSRSASEPPAERGHG